MGHAWRLSFLAAIALAGCGGYPDDGDSETAAQLDRARHRIRPAYSEAGALDRASKLRQKDAKSDAPLDLIASEKLIPINAGKAFEGITEDAFGAAVVTSGNTVVVGAPDRDDLGLGNSGAVYIFVNDNGVWNLEQKLLAKDGGVNDNFGFSLALEGDRLLIGSRRGGGGGAPQSGAVYVYERSGKVWNRTAKLDPTNTGFEDYFGYAVALYQDVALVGAPQADNAGVKSGAAFLYRFDGISWALEKKFTPESGTDSDFYGGAVALLPPTGAFSVTALVGSWDDNDSPGDYEGAVYAYVDPDPVSGQPWGLQAKLVASDQTAGDTFSFSLSAVGQRAFIGAPFRGDVCENAGAVYVFNRHSGIWCEEAIITPYDKNAGQLFGYAVSAWDETVLIGSSYDDDGGDYSGSAYVYKRQDLGWEAQLKFVPDDTAPLQLVGFAVALEGDRAVAGAIGDITNNVNAGSTYLFSATGAAAPVAPPVTELVSGGNAQCSLHGGSSSTQSSWFIGIAIATLGIRRAGRARPFRYRSPLPRASTNPPTK